MKKLVFICHGNAFRSPIAEAIFNHNPKEGWRASSYGTAVVEENAQGIKLIDLPYSLEVVINEMKKRGIDITEKFSDQLYPEYLKDADKVVVILEDKFIPGWLLKRGDERWEILNPEKMTEEIALYVINLLTEKIEILKKNL